jgi:hypothetical protein
MDATERSIPRYALNCFVVAGADARQVVDDICLPGRELSTIRGATLLLPSWRTHR